MASNADIYTAIFGHIASLAITDWDDEDLALYFPEVVNTGDAKPTSQHIMINLLSTDAKGLSVSGGHKNVQDKWIVQLTLRVRDGLGMIKPAIVIDKIVDAMPMAKTFGGNLNLKVSSPPNVIQRLDGNEWIGYPVQVSVIHISN